MASDNNKRLIFTLLIFLFDKTYLLPPFLCPALRCKTLFNIIHKQFFERKLSTYSVGLTDSKLSNGA